MNSIVGFRKCTLSNSDLSAKVDKMTDDIYKSESKRVPNMHIPARPDEDYDLLVGELCVRLKETDEQLLKSKEDNQELIEAMSELHEWHKKYPPGKVYDYGRAKTIERQLTDIVEKQIKLIQKHTTK